MKNKNGKVSSGVVLVIAILLGAYFLVPSVQTTVNGIFAQKATETPSGTSGTGIGTSGQNPTLTLKFTNALTGQPITAIVDNVLDVNTGFALGKPTSATDYVSGTTFLPLVNASGYIMQIQPAYKVTDGSQQLKGTLFQYANATIRLYNNAGTATIGGTAIANDSVSTTTLTNKMVLESTQYRSTGRQFIVFEVSNGTSVSSVALNPLLGSPAAVAMTVPNCYANNLTGTPYRQAWELPAVTNGNAVTYNLVTTAANGKAISGQASLTVYSERDGIDTGTGKLLTSGICDSLNTAFWKDTQQNIWWYL